MKLIKKIQASYATRGMLGTARWFLNGYCVINKFIVFYRDLEGSFKPPELESSIKVFKISLDTLSSLRMKVEDLPVEFYCDKIYGFTSPYIAEVNGEIAAIHWLVMPGETSRFLRLETGDLELNFNTVLPRFRGRRLAELLMSEIISSNSGGDFKRLFGVVHVSNIPQYKQMMRLGFEPVEVVTHFGFFRPKATLRYV